MLLGGVGGTHMLLVSGAVAVAAGVLELDSSRCARLPIKREARQLLQIRFCTCESSVVQQFDRCTQSWRGVIGPVAKPAHSKSVELFWTHARVEANPVAPIARLASMERNRRINPRVTGENRSELLARQALPLGAAFGLQPAQLLQ